MSVWRGVVAKDQGVEEILWTGFGFASESQVAGNGSGGREVKEVEEIEEAKETWEGCVRRVAMVAVRSWFEEKMCRTYGALFCRDDYPALPGWAKFCRASGAWRKRFGRARWCLSGLRRNA